MRYDRFSILCGDSTEPTRVRTKIMHNTVTVQVLFGKFLENFALVIRRCIRIVIVRIVVALFWGDVIRR